MVKSTRFDRLLASTALLVVLALPVHTAVAQQSGSQAQSAVPMPDTSQLPPLTAKDIEPPAKTAAPADIVKDEPKQTTAAPVVEPAKAVAAPAAPPVPVADSPVAEKVRELITGKQFDRLVSRKADRAGIEAFYSARNYAPLWVSDNAANARAKDAISYLAQADAVGLDPNDYPTPDFKAATNADALAEAEIKLTASALTFARQAQIGRIHYSRVGADIQYDLVAPEAADVLAQARRRQ